MYIEIPRNTSERAEELSGTVSSSLSVGLLAALCHPAWQGFGGVLAEVGRPKFA